MKPIKHIEFDLRDWQAEAFRACYQKAMDGKKDFLCVATPGAGKTKFALRAAHYFLKSRAVERIVVVTPSEQLKKQWALAAASFAGLDIDPDFKNSQIKETSEFHGMAITYALLAQDKHNVHKSNCDNVPTGVIFDEPHHGGDELSWGKAVLNAFEKAVFRISISGTPFRSDDCEIPFIKYENGVSKSDYNYSYERAIVDNVCRPVYFKAFDGVMRWSVEETEYEHGFKDHLEPDQESRRLRTALHHENNYVRDMLKEANEKLTEIRRSHPDAGGLVFAMDQKHARELAKILFEITGEKCPVVISDDAASNDKIDSFAKSRERWLISVKMVSEGVDIPRLRIGVYLTIVKAELFFRQAVGRFVRVLQHLQWQDAYIFIPQDRDIVKLAEQIQEEREHALDKCDPAGQPGDQESLFPEYTPALRGKFTPLSSSATDTRMISVSVGISSGMQSSLDTRQIITPDSPVFLQKKQLRGECQDLAKRIALRQVKGNPNIKPDFRFAHSKWIENGGKNIDLESIEELKARKQFFQKLLMTA